MINLINFILGISITINLVIIASAIVIFQRKQEKRRDGEEKILSRSTSDFESFWR